MDKDKEIHRIEVRTIPQDISADDISVRDILEEYIISRTNEKINAKTTSSSKIL